MEAIEKLKRKRPRGKRGSKAARYSVEFKQQAVRFYLEEGYPSGLISRELGIGNNTLRGWARAYQEHGEAGLVPRNCGPRKAPKPSPVKDHILRLKRENPQRGVRRISQILRRIFLPVGLSSR